MNASLNQTEKTVLELRRCGMSFADCGDKLGITKQACYKAEKSALAKQGQRESLYQSQHKQDQIEYGAIYRDKGAHVTLPEMIADHADTAPASWYRITRQAKVEKLERIVDKLVDDLAAGRASAEWTWRRIVGIQTEMARAG